MSFLRGIIDSFSSIFNEESKQDHSVLSSTSSASMNTIDGVPVSNERRNTTEEDRGHSSLLTSSFLLCHVRNGDALNKAVRETAHETITAIFSEENGNKPAPTENIARRIEGFGNTNFQVPSNDNKSFLSEVVGIGSASIKQGISNLAQGHLPKKNENGISCYRGPNLHRSLTMENENFSRYDPVKLGKDGNYGISKNTSGGSWGHGSGEASESSASVRVEDKTREEKLLETIVTSGGVRLQPTRDALHIFILEAAKMDAVALSIALDGKLQSPMWQVLMKALCVLEAILRKKDDDHFSIVHTYFSENMDAIQRCSESPQSSLREKANKVDSAREVEDTPTKLYL